MVDVTKLSDEELSQRCETWKGVNKYIYLESYKELKRRNANQEEPDEPKEEKPTSSSKKSEIKEYLDKQGISYKKSAKKAELLKLVD